MRDCYSVYSVQVRPRRVGWTSALHIQTDVGDPGEPWWMIIEPIPTWWRPTEAWANRRALRELARIKQEETRRRAEAWRLRRAGWTA